VAVTVLQPEHLEDEQPVETLDVPPDAEPSWSEAA
jgi:hypothetical protein